MMMMIMMMKICLNTVHLQSVEIAFQKSHVLHLYTMSSHDKIYYRIIYIYKHEETTIKYFTYLKIKTLIKL